MESLDNQEEERGTDKEILELQKELEELGIP